MKSPERTTTTIMIFAVASSLVVLAVMILFGLLVGGAVGQLTVGTSPHPYDALNRPIPPDEITRERLFPPALGEFQRADLRGNLENFYAVYRHGEDQVTVRGSRAITFVAAQALVKRAAGGGVGSTAQLINEADPRYSYVLFTSGNNARFIWSRNRWYFDVQTNSKAALDAFMKAFQY